MTVFISVALFIICLVDQVAVGPAVHQQPATRVEERCFPSLTSPSLISPSLTSPLPAQTLVTAVHRIVKILKLWIVMILHRFPDSGLAKHRSHLRRPLRPLGK